ncbi:DUF2977 domain-containing protein [Pediococcus acidilactici]|uniref:DUF2977 domain-containing protein n=1 Tax=Pediococcus acidilactici TaxID=1254 RepID=UPI000BEEB428|nr:DUF2977 domain-containing protein [Pediococcus acidilactici]MCQ0050340.1 DUF2977 domain-containing protein [Pediococcus acidilactici]MCQ0052575.1 DUF2977 domain-containing protein [Pediococcus acidilactici]MCQ0054233.1 DUF2977 domain-containing protein [Pediococcus acidilactici]MCQ0061679.1 DUF2977 domain-containing protein [Pediococcus acidilactici]MCQ0068827.1 DUF2977 domain-containing protein [Pediococcus acidilactici]
MELVLKNNEIIEYAIVGHISGSVYYDGNLPEEFNENFKPSYYLLKDNEIVENPDYIAPSNDAPDNNIPTASDKAIAALTLQMAKQSEKQDEFNAQLLLKIAQLGGEANV